MLLLINIFILFFKPHKLLLLFYRFIVHLDLSTYLLVSQPSPPSISLQLSAIIFLLPEVLLLGFPLNYVHVHWWGTEFIWKCFSFTSIFFISCGEHMPGASILLGWLQVLNTLIWILSLNSMISSVVAAPSIVSGILLSRESLFYPFC